MALEINHARNIGRLFRPYNWEINLSGVPGASPAQMHELSLRCSTASLPGIAVGAATDIWFKRVRVSREYGRRRWDDEWTLKFRESDKLVVYKVFSEWLRMICDPSTGNGDPTLKKPAIPMRLLDDADALVLKVTVLGMQPTKLAGYGLEWDSETPVDCTVTCSFEDLELAWP